MALFPNWSGSASPSSYRCSPTCGRTWCSATIGRTFPAPTMTWSAAFAGSRPSTAASVVARIGTPICYATGARSPTPPGGSKMRPIESRWNSAPPSWTVPAGANCDVRPPSLRASNSRAFVFVTSASPCSFPSKSAGPLLLSRRFCPDGKKTARDRLIAWASQQPTWAIGFGDEVWWSRFALPHVHAWQSQDQPVRLVEQPWRKDDPDPKALACYGVLWQHGPTRERHHHPVLGVVLPVPAQARQDPLALDLG